MSDRYRTRRLRIMKDCIARGYGGRCACACRCDLVVNPPLSFKEAKARGFPSDGHAKFPTLNLMNWSR